MKNGSALDGLRAKHATLEDKIAQEQRRPLPDEEHLTALKREKLRIKDQMAGHLSA